MPQNDPKRKWAQDWPRCHAIFFDVFVLLFIFENGAFEMSKSVSGTEPGQRQLNGPQTSGRDYRNLSNPEHEVTREDDVAVPMRDGVQLLADVFRPTAPGCYPVL